MPDPGWSDHCGDRVWRRHVLAVAGFDICDVVGPSPRSPREWAAMMKRLGARDLAGVVAAVHGRSIDPRLARRGDLVRSGWALGVCRGELAVFYGGEAISMSRVDEAWHVEPSPWSPAPGRRDHG